MSIRICEATRGDQSACPNPARFVVYRPDAAGSTVKRLACGVHRRMLTADGNATSYPLRRSRFGRRPA